MLEALADRQENYRSILMGLRQQEDKTFEEAFVVATPEGVDDNVVVTVAVVLDAVARRDDEDVSHDNILEAIEFIDHLDTLNMKIVPK